MLHGMRLARRFVTAPDDSFERCTDVTGLFHLCCNSAGMPHLLCVTGVRRVD
jgi:hypothetical protein